MMDSVRKTGKDLKVGDICYGVSSDGSVSKEEITNIYYRKSDDGTRTEMALEFNTRVKGTTSSNDETSTYGMYSCTVCFSKEKAKELLEKKIEHIKENIEKLETM